jgi:flavin-dependent dehydrogenase
MEQAQVALDVLVVGGGPAGSAAAITLRNAGLSVGIVERSDYGAVRIGETLSPGAQTLLRFLGIEDAIHADGHLPAFGTKAAWGSEALATRDFLLTPFGTGFHLDRRRFDRRLAETATERGATLWQTSRVRGLERAGARWRVLVERRDQRLAVEARFLIDATGKSQAIGRRLGAERRFLDRQVAAVAAATFDGEPPTDTLALVEVCELGWWYSAKLGGGTLILALMTDADLARVHRVASADTWRALARAMPHTAERLAGATALARPRIVPACSACLVQVWGDGWVAVGDAAGSHDPLSSSGIARALDSGIRAALAVSSALRHDRSDELQSYDAYMSQSYDQYCFTRTRYYQMEQRWPDAPFWRRRQNQLTLHPHARLGSPPIWTRPGAVPRLPADLRHLDASILLTACERPRPAHDVVSEYHARAARRATDAEVILALQWLVSAGALAMSLPE